jgi:3-hydroxymyristoyl/3-hydroxydecanoyl-(acyl carrier protein) dehydratase
MAQVGGILARVSVNEGLDKAGSQSIYFMSIDKVKFRRPVVPGDQLRFELTPLRTGNRIWKMEGRAYVDGSLAAEAEFMAQIGQ